MIEIQIKNRWTGEIIFKYSKENNTIAETVMEAVKSKANLSEADLSEADLSVIKNDFWAKLLKLKNEIPAFKEKIIAGQIDGSCYEGACCCFVGTFANIKGCDYKKLEGVYPDSGSPTEKWFMGISQGHTPESSQIVKITMEWIEEFEMYLSK